MMKLLQKALRPGATALVAMLLIGSFVPMAHAFVFVDTTKSTVDACPGNVSSCSGATPLTALSADGVSEATVQVRLVDSNGSGVSGETVTLVPDNALDFQINPVNAGATTLSGFAFFHIVAPTATGVTTFTAHAANAGVDLATTVLIDFKDVSMANSSLVPVQPNAFADDATAATFALHAADSQNPPAPLVGKSVVVYDINSDGTLLNTITGITTDGNGDASLAVTSLIYGQHTIAVSVDGVYLPQVNADFYPTPTVDVSPASAPADGNTPIIEGVTFYDLNNQPNVGLIVNGTVTAPVFGAVKLNGVTPNINNFVVTQPTGYIPFPITSSVPQQVQVQLTVFGGVVVPVNGAQFATLNFVAAAPDPSKSDVGVSPISVPANGVNQSAVTVSVYDTNNQPMTSQTVTLTPVSNPAAGLSFPTTATTDNLGTALFPITSTEVTQEAFTVSVGNVVIGTTAMIDFTAPIADQNSFVDVAPSSVPADGTPATVKVLLTDANGIAIPNQLVTVGYDLNGSQFSNWGTTDLSGAVSIDVSSTMVGTVALDVTANGVLLNTHPTVDFTPAPIDYVNSTITASPAVVPGDGVTPVTVNVYIVDTNGQPVAGQITNITMAVGGTKIISLAATTDAMGVISQQFTYGNGGAALFTVSANGTPFAQTAQATFIASASPAVAFSSVTASPSMVPADATTASVVTVHAGTIGGLPVVNQMVSLAADPNAPAQMDITALNGALTDVNGNVSFLVTSPNGGAATLTATVDNGLVPVTLAQTVTVTFVGLLPPAVIDVTNSNVMPQPSTVPADGITSSLVTVTLVDANTNMPAAGQLVSLADITGLSGVTITPNNAGVTDALGAVSFVVTGSTVGQATLAATVNGVTLNKATVDFTVVPPDATQSNFSVYPTSLMPNSGNPAVVTVVLIDQFGNPVANYPIDLVLTGVPAGMTVTASPALSALSDAQGAATFTLTADTVGSFDLAVSANGLMIGSSVTIHVQTMHQGHSDMTVSPATLPADGTSTAILTVTARDAQGVAIVGQQIVLSGGGSGVTVVGNGVTDQSGVALYKISSTNAGTVVFSAKMGSVLFSQTATINFTSTGNSGQIGGGSSGGSSGGGGNFSAAPPAAPAPKVLGAHTGELVKIASNSAVYFVATDGKRHAFPNEKVYFTWYQNFDDVVTISDAEMAALPLGTNVTYRPGTRMVKFQSLAKVYVVGKGGELRWVGSESLAASLYGAHWAKMVDDVSDAFYVNYHFGADVTEVTGFNPATETAAVPTIDENI